MAGSIEVRDLRVERGSFVLEVPRLSVRPREVFAILGSTGSGKTVLMESIAGAFLLDGGCILLDGKDVESLPVQQRHLGILYQDYALFPHMTVRENIAYGLRMSGCPPRERDERVQAMLSLFDIGHLAERYPGIISGGESQRTALARALVLEPEILLLDEPFNGLDPEGTRAMRNLIVRLNQTLGVTVVISSHVLDQLDRVATRFGVIAEGRMVREMTSEQVQAECGDSLRVRTVDPARSLALMEEAFPQATLRALPDGSLSVTGDYDAAAVSRLLHDADQTVLELNPVRRDIEDYFVELMEGGARGAAGVVSGEEGGARHV